jgi:hypothetical protein
MLDPYADPYALEDYIHLKIISLDYISKMAAWERKQNSQKLKDAKSDF